jgi:hypothetical protein
MTAFRTQPPNLRATNLMDMDFAVIGPLVRRFAPLSGFCSSARAFARRFLQTPPYGGRPCALLPFTSIRLGEDFHFQAVIQCSAHLNGEEQLLLALLPLSEPISHRSRENGAFHSPGGIIPGDSQPER